jgi:hypothetical protein
LSAPDNKVPVTRAANQPDIANALTEFALVILPFIKRGKDAFHHVPN